MAKTPQKYQVRIPSGTLLRPQNHEITAAQLLSSYFEADVYFVAPTIHRTADFKIGNIYWELKSPTGSGKRTIQHTLQNALKQSSNIVVDARYSKMRIDKFRKELERQMLCTGKIRRLLLITKTNRVVEIRH